MANIKNNANSGSKVTDQQAGLASIAFAVFATANYTDNFTFATFANITLKKEPKIYKSNLFLFTVNQQ